MKYSLDLLKIFAISVIFFSGGTVYGTAQSASDQAEFPTPDMIACLKAVEPFHTHYRGEMQLSCLGEAAEICVFIDKGTGSCMQGLVTSMREFYGRLVPLLPSQIDGKGFRAQSYERALPRLAETFANVPDCIDLNVSEFSTCEFLDLGSATIDLLQRARMAEIELP